MGIVGIELVAWIIYCGAQTYKARAQRCRAHGRKLENATSCCTPILESFTAGEVVEMRGTTQMFLSSARLVGDPTWPRLRLCRRWKLKQPPLASR
jgi:hypothetical protein